jgi:hypothetical protein
VHPNIGTKTKEKSEDVMKKYISWIILGFLVVAIGILAFFLVNANKENVTLNNTVESFKNSTIADQVEQQQSAQADIAAGLSTQTALQNQISTLQTQAVNDQLKFDDLSKQFTQLESLVDCANKNLFKPDYVSNSRMSDALKKFVNSATGLPVDTANWEPIWNGLLSAYHNVYFFKDHQRLKQPYLVFFIDPSVKLKQGVFDINNQCWLDR